MQLLGFGRMVESQGACFHGVIGLLVAMGLQISIFFAATGFFGRSLHNETLRISFTRSITPFLEPFEQQRIGTLGWHGVGASQAGVNHAANAVTGDSAKSMRRRSGRPEISPSMQQRRGEQNKQASRGSTLIARRLSRLWRLE